MPRLPLPLLLVSLATPFLGGCLAKTAFDVATAPVRVAGKAVDVATTSQSEADENRGRELRRREEQLGKLERQWHDLDEDCRDGDQDACTQRDSVAREIDTLRPTIPQRYEN